MLTPQLEGRLRLAEDGMVADEAAAALGRSLKTFERSARSGCQGLEERLLEHLARCLLYTSDAADDM
eukprot:3377031-Prymnesium_polylepis.1